jgi:hypothetical protein
MQEEIGMRIIVILRLWRFSGGSDLKNNNFDILLMKFTYLIEGYIC